MINTSHYHNKNKSKRNTIYTHTAFVGGEWGKVQNESKLHHKSQEQTSQAINSKKTCGHYLLHQIGMNFVNALTSEFVIRIALFVIRRKTPKVVQCLQNFIHSEFKCSV